MKYNVIARLFVVAFVFIGSTISLHNLAMTNFEGYLEDGPANIPPYHEVLSKTAPKPRMTLVLFDPHFLGGFRNQHMRFVAFVAFAVEHNISQILLPSLRWSDNVNKSKSLQHDVLFDVPYWNSRAESVGLPLLVNYDADSLEGIIHTNQGNHTSVATVPVPCFNETSGLYSGIDESLLRRPGVNLRRVNTYAMIGQGEVYSHCLRTLGENGENNPDKIKEIARQDINSTKVYRFTYLIPHGGLLGGSGRLWHEYSALQSNRGKASMPTLVDGEEFAMIYPEHVPVEKAVYDLLRPSQHLQKSITDSINRAVQNHTQQNDHQPRLLALHPRIEQEMLGHRCNKHMESNITRLLDHIQTFTPFHDGNNSNSYRFDSVFMAVSKEGVEKESNKGGHIGEIINHNRLALRQFRKVGLFNGIPLFESGTESAAKIQLPMISNNNASSATNFVSVVDLGVIELVASIIDFFTAVSADIFVGVKGSTFSTDVSSVRYYQHKEDGGGENYVVGPYGIERRFGPPAPHFC